MLQQQNRLAGDTYRQALLRSDHLVGDAYRQARSTSENLHAADRAWRDPPRRQA